MPKWKNSNETFWVIFKLSGRGHWLYFICFHKVGYNIRQCYNPQLYNSNTFVSPKK